MPDFTRIKFGKKIDWSILSTKEFKMDSFEFRSQAEEILKRILQIAIQNTAVPARFLIPTEGPYAGMDAASLAILESW